MKFIYGKNDWSSVERAQENCYLLTNGLGGYSSLTAVGSMARNDHALLMACTRAPDQRVNAVSRLDEVLTAGEEEILLSSQQFVNHTKNREGFRYQDVFQVEDYPLWVYGAAGVELRKEIVMKHGENTLAIRYKAENRTGRDCFLCVTPWMQFVQKGALLSRDQVFETLDGTVTSGNFVLRYCTNGESRQFDPKYESDLYYPMDARDGRAAVGAAAATHSVRFTLPAGKEVQCLILYSFGEKEASGMGTEGTDSREGVWPGRNACGKTDWLAAYVDNLFMGEKERIAQLHRQSGLHDETALQLVKSADQFLSERVSTGGKTILAGYPFFGDWGRDTMIAVTGICISANRFGEAKDIFRTFMRYLNKGLMPNMFPEDGKEPCYNTADASLLFIAAVNDYYEASKDLDFVKEAWPSMEEIIAWYRKGTDYHIRMDEDGLIMAGAEFEQVTWMDVRIGDILPTPRHGKPVEINAYWYHDLIVMDQFEKILHGENGNQSYAELAGKVRAGFRNAFWNEKEGCLKDTVSVLNSDQESDHRIRCNQIWAVSLANGMLTEEEECKVVDKVYAHLYTPYGLRSLSPSDSLFCPAYGGSQYVRDLSYHQGTVWAFPLGGYYLAYLKVRGYSKEAVMKVKEQLSALEPCLREGCAGQIAEIYDGLTPNASRGCFAQAWSVGELLRVYRKIEEAELKWNESTVSGCKR